MGIAGKDGVIQPIFHQGLCKVDGHARRNPAIGKGGDAAARTCLE